MQPHVNFHASRRGETLQTALTLEGLNTSVCFHMCRESTLHSKRSETLFTLERLLVGVDADVADKVTWFFELFGAVRAAMPANTVLFPDRP